MENYGNHTSQLPVLPIQQKDFNASIFYDIDYISQNHSSNREAIFECNKCKVKYRQNTLAERLNIKGECFNCSKIEKITQKDFKAIFIKDLGIKNKKHYALFECKKCNKNFSKNVKTMLRHQYKMCTECILIDNPKTTNIRLYQIWRNILGRTNVHKNIDNTWRDFQIFSKWAIENKYTDMSYIKLVDKTKNYEPDNCIFEEPEDKTSYRNITEIKKTKRWKAQIFTYGYKKHIGYYRNQIEAALAYDNYIIDNNLDRQLNFKIEGR